MLFVLLGVGEIYAAIMSRSAKKILDEYGIKYSCGEEVEYIINRKKDGMCPMEKAVMDNAKIYFLFSAVAFPFIALYDDGASILRAQEKGDEHQLSGRFIGLLYIFASQILGTDHRASGRQGKKRLHD